METVALFFFSLQLVNAKDSSIYFRFYSFVFMFKAADFQAFITEFVSLLVTGMWNSLATLKIIILEII